MKNIIREVIFPIYGSWTVESFAWSKELARQLKVPFQVLRLHSDSVGDSQKVSLQLLEGDGYYFTHFYHGLPKSQMQFLSGEFGYELLRYLQRQLTCSILVLPPSLLQTNWYTDLLKCKQHLIISFPSEVKKTDQTSEFAAILKQITILQFPFTVS